MHIYRVTWHIAGSRGERFFSDKSKADLFVSQLEAAFLTLQVGGFERPIAMQVMVE